MSEPIYARLEHEASILIHHGQLNPAEFQRVWRRIRDRPETPEYDSPTSTVLKENPMSAADTLLADFQNFLTKAEADAAKVQRYESEPMTRDILDLLESVPEARDILTPVLAGVGKLASLHPATASADPTAPEGPVDPQIQTGVAS